MILRPSCGISVLQFLFLRRTSQPKKAVGHAPGFCKRSCCALVKSWSQPDLLPLKMYPPPQKKKSRNLEFCQILFWIHKQLEMVTLKLDSGIFGLLRGWNSWKIGDTLQVYSNDISLYFPRFPSHFVPNSKRHQRFSGRKQAHRIQPMMWWVSNIFYIFTPKIGEDEPNLTHIFQRGWFNHQLVFWGFLKSEESPQPRDTIDGPNHQLATLSVCPFQRSWYLQECSAVCRTLERLGWFWGWGFQKPRWAIWIW